LLQKCLIIDFCQQKCKRYEKIFVQASWMSGRTSSLSLMMISPLLVQLPLVQVVGVVVPVLLLVAGLVMGKKQHDISDLILLFWVLHIFDQRQTNLPREQQNFYTFLNKIFIKHLLSIQNHCHVHSNYKDKSFFIL